MFSGEAIWAAAAMTWLSSGFPPISWSTLGRRDLRRVPLPAAMMTTASSDFSPNSSLLTRGLVLLILTILPSLKERDSYRAQRESPSVGFLLLAPCEQGSLHRRSGPRRPLSTRQSWCSHARTRISSLQRQYSVAHPLSRSRPEGRAFPSIAGNFRTEILRTSVINPAFSISQFSYRSIDRRNQCLAVPFDSCPVLHAQRSRTPGCLRAGSDAELQRSVLR